MSLRDDVAALLRDDFPNFMKPAAERLADAILPLVIERCAEVMIAHQREVDDDNSYWGGPHKRHYDTPRELAAAIRNLGSEA